VDWAKLARVVERAEELAPRLKKLQCMDDWFERPRRVLFHELGWLHQYTHTQQATRLWCESLCAHSALRDWAGALVREHPPRRLHEWDTCTVVGSSPAILGSGLGVASTCMTSFFASTPQ